MYMYIYILPMASQVLELRGNIRVYDDVTLCMMM
jgi:hypothetical protein